VLAGPAPLVHSAALEPAEPRHLPLLCAWRRLGLPPDSSHRRLRGILGRFSAAPKLWWRGYLILALAKEASASFFCAVARPASAPRRWPASASSDGRPALGPGRLGRVGRRALGGSVGRGLLLLLLGPSGTLGHRLGVASAPWAPARLTGKRWCRPTWFLALAKASSRLLLRRASARFLAAVSAWTRAAAGFAVPGSSGLGRVGRLAFGGSIICSLLLISGDFAASLEIALHVASAAWAACSVAW